MLGWSNGEAFCDASSFLGGGNSNIFLCSPRSLGKWSNLTNIFQLGWNDQLVKFSRWWFQIFFMFTPIPWEMIQFVFQMGWNHQLVFEMTQTAMFGAKGFLSCRVLCWEVASEIQPLQLHPGRLTWNLRIRAPWKRIFILPKYHFQVLC